MSEVVAFPGAEQRARGGLMQAARRVLRAAASPVAPGFTLGTLVETERGAVPVEALKEGDRVVTRDTGIQTVRAVTVTAAIRGQSVLIRAGSLGNNAPAVDLIVSPNHRVVVVRDQSVLFFEGPEVTCLAKHLVNGDSIEYVTTDRETRYIDISFDRPAALRAHGVWCECVPQRKAPARDTTQASISAPPSADLFTLFPELAISDGTGASLSAPSCPTADKAGSIQL
ncbi:MAG: Hint domain-containing protein [Pseudomonadota bacterium]